MPKIDVYLRSIERFGALGAVLASGQSVTLRFPTGDRHATQVTAHDQLVAVVREIAPPGVAEQLDKERPARFEFESNGARYSIGVTPRSGAWSVAIEPASGAATATIPPPTTPLPSPTTPLPSPAIPQPVAAIASGRIRLSAPMAAVEPPPDMAIERGQYSQTIPPATTTVPSPSGSTLLDALTAAARGVRATDVYLATGAVPLGRVGSELQPVGDRTALDAETLARELGIVAPPAARAAWSEPGAATFAYSDGLGRVRATLVRDHRGPGAALRLLPAEAPAIDRLGIGRQCVAWLDQRGLVLVGGPSGAGKTTTLSALVRALGDRKRRVVVLEDPIEIVQVGPTVSQRAIGVHAPTLTAGVASAMREGADAIVVGAVTTSEHATAVVDAVAAGHLVLAAIATQSASAAVDRLVDLLPHDRRDVARGAMDRMLLGALAPVLKGGGRAFDVVAGRGG